MKLPITFALVAAVAACSSAPSSPKSPVERTGRAERIQIGSLEAYAVSDGDLVIPNDGKTFGVGRQQSEIDAVLAAAKLPRDPLHLELQSLLVKTGDHVILFDTGAGAATFAKGGHLIASLAVANVQPEAVTDIFISHAHPDHVGGLVTKDRALAFPSATIRMSAPEWASLQADAGDAAKQLVAAIAPKVTAFEPGAQVLPVVKAVATPGHTPGHSSYEVGAATDADKLFYLGDLAHHSIISVEHPDWSVQFDQDHAAAEAMRQQTLAKLAADRVRVFAVHFPYPGVGHVVAEGQGLVWKPEAR